MALSGTPTDYSNNITGRLKAKITATQTSSITVTADTYQIGSGSAAAVTFPTGEMILKLTRKTRTSTQVEYIGVESGTTQSGSTVTLGTCIRNLSSSDGTDFTSQGDGIAFAAGTIVELVWGVHQAEQSLYKNVQNTLTGSGQVTSSSTSTAVVRFNSVTTAQRTAMSPSNGDVVYDSDVGALFQYVGGGWSQVGDTGTVDATTTTAGKSEKATTADIRAETATGDSGAPLFIPADATSVLKDDRVVLKDATELTIATGAVTVTQAYHSIDTESDAASDDLDTITAAVGAGETITLKAANAARTVTLKHNTGNIQLANGKDFDLDDTEKRIVLIYDGTDWVEECRNGGYVSMTVAAEDTISGAGNVDISATSWTDISTLTEDISVETGDVLLLTASGNYNSNVGSPVGYFTFSVGGTEVTGTTYGLLRVDIAGGSDGVFSITHVYKATSTTTLTCKPQAKVDAGTMRIPTSSETLKFTVIKYS